MFTIPLDLELAAELPEIPEHTPVIFACLPPSGMMLELLVDGETLEPFLHPGDATWYWRWNPGTAVGVHTLVLHSSFGGKLTAGTLRVTPAKLDADRYQVLLQDLQTTTLGLALALAVSSEQIDLTPEERTDIGPYAADLALLGGRLDRLEHALRRIAAQPRTTLKPTTIQTTPGELHTPDPQALILAALRASDPAPPELAGTLPGGRVPHMVPEQTNTATSDTYEHRLALHVLGILRRRAHNLRQRFEAQSGQLPAAQRNRLERLAAELADAEQRMTALMALPFFQGVRRLTAFHGPSQLMQHNAAYRTIYRMWQDLRRHPQLTFTDQSDTLPISDLPRLYERWCVLRTVQALLNIGGSVAEQHLFAERRDDTLELGIALREDAPLLVLEQSAQRLTLRYHPRYTPLSSANVQRLGSLDRHTRIPDIAIEVHTDGKPPLVLVLDAKYRLDSDGRGVPQDALDSAYAYRGAIGYAGQPATLGVVLLYPGIGAPEIYPSGIATLPLLPDAPDGLVELIAGWVRPR